MSRNDAQYHIGHNAPPGGAGVRHLDSLPPVDRHLALPSLLLLPPLLVHLVVHVDAASQAQPPRQVRHCRALSSSSLLLHLKRCTGDFYDGEVMAIVMIIVIVMVMGTDSVMAIVVVMVMVSGGGGENNLASPSKEGRKLVSILFLAWHLSNLQQKSNDDDLGN